MHKLKLESLQVESFQTSHVTPQPRGTVQAHGKPQPPQTYNKDLCGDTLYFDCTLGCSINTNCAGACGPSYDCVLTAAGCV